MSFDKFGCTDFEVPEELEDFISVGDVETDRIFEEREGESPNLSANFDKVVVVENIPKGVPPEKHDKLINRIITIFKQAGTILENEFYLSKKDDGTTAGWCYVPFSSVEGANKCLRFLEDGVPLDKVNVLKGFCFHDLLRFLDWPETYEQPEKPEINKINLNSWLEHPDVRDQYLLRYSDMTEVVWCESPSFDAVGSVVYDGARERERGKIWCEMYTQWSPRGHYLLTFHSLGVMLWGGNKFERINRFEHPQVQHVDFSPDEGYLMTWNGFSDKRALIGWNLKTGEEIRTFKVDHPKDSMMPEWPIMRWSVGDKYFARKVVDGISVFSSSDFLLLDNKPIKLKGIKEFAWSTSDPIFAYWAPGIDNLPARVVILNPGTKTEMRAKNLFNVRDIKLHWQDDGDFLCAQVLRHSKTGKTTFTNFEVFRLRDANVPNEMIEVKDYIAAFLWEPKRERFAVLHGESEQQLHVSFYTLGAIKGGNNISLLCTIQNKRVASMHWSPAGNKIMFQGKGMAAALEFWDVDENVMTASGEHFMCNEVSWDPSGRMVTTSVVSGMYEAMKYSNESGFKIWSAEGRLLCDEKREQFYQFLWRPRPKTILDDQTMQKIFRGIKGYMARLSKEDDVRKGFLEAAASREKIESLQAFRALVDIRQVKVAKENKERISLGLSSIVNEDEFEVTNEVLEVFVSQTVEPLNG